MIAWGTRARAPIEFIAGSAAHYNASFGSRASGAAAAAGMGKNSRAPTKIVVKIRIAETNPL